MIETKLVGLRKIGVIQDASEDDLNELDQVTRLGRYSPGHIFFTPEENTGSLFLLIEGRVQLYRLSLDGKKLVVAMLEPGEIFGEMSLIGRGTQNTFAEAFDKCLVCVLSSVDAKRMVTDMPHLALRFIDTVIRRVQELEVKLEQFAFRSIPVRIATLLLDLSQNFQCETVLVGYTHQDIAEMLGTYRETVTYTLNKFKNQGWIDIRRREIKILDREALLEFAQHPDLNHAVLTKRSFVEYDLAAA
jgi:CRP/FNR family cyclic AMP-dependent transcriptional regulator